MGIIFGFVNYKFVLSTVQEINRETDEWAVVS